MSVRYEPAIDLAEVTAIDTHVHVEVDDHGHFALPPALLDASAAHFHADDRAPTIDTIAEQYRERRMAAVIFTVDAGTALGHPAISSEEIAAAASRHRDVLIPFGSVDPLTGVHAVDRARRLVGDHGVRGFKFHPSLQAFDPSDSAYAPLWAAIAELGVPAIFHTGQNGIGAGLPGGYGIKLAYSNPLLLDVVAAEHPDLTLIFAHPSVPWQDEANAVAIHKTNVYIDLSGWSPKYFPESLVRLANRQLQDRVLFATDFPLITPEKWLAAFADLPIDDAVRPKILKDNAARLLGLT
ncbi:MAG: amidohydrolase family protein [Pseudolysinimonas sp.]